MTDTSALGHWAASKIVYILLLSLGAIFGCAGLQNHNGKQAAVEKTSQWSEPAADKIVVFFFRHSNFSGGGRIHLLKIDGHVVGEITGRNCYRIELWPGTYQFTIHLPAEEFFGQKNPPRSISTLVHFGPSDAGSAFGLQYSDGMGGRSFTRHLWNRMPAFMSDRLLSGSLSARDTAQVRTFMDARYDGPALNGQPHGKGALTWPDGSVYRGTFEYGRPTNTARFFFPDGKTYMGQFHKGRPGTPGVLSASNGDIIFAGDFVDEKPDGIGLRIRDKRPEFCQYDQGRDITQSFRNLAREALNIEDEKQIEAFSRRSNRLGEQIQAAKARFKDSDVQSSLSADQAAELENRIQTLEFDRSRLERTAASDLRKFVESLRASRWERELIKVMQLKNDHQARVDEERTWCREEFALNRRPCRCAPLADNFSIWDTCEDQIEKRFDSF